ncbi:DnaB-like helicase C-terminal domain-containing protein [Kitasatospora cineracea]|nr:DnaB-like helicase C-terminal domain-containing protein [Kitasatospora cineracea]
MTLADGPGPTEPLPVLTGLSDLDDLTGPLPRGKLTVLAGRPSAGTSALALTIALNANATGRTAAFVNLQAGAEALKIAMLSATAGINADRPESLNPGRIDRMHRAGEFLKGRPLLSWTPEGTPVLRGIRNTLANHTVDVLLVDDVGLLSPHSRYDATAVKELAGLAAADNVALVLTAHLRPTRDGYHLPPTTDDLYDPELAAAADALVLLHRPNFEGGAPKRGSEVDLIAVKGWPRTGTATVRFEPEYHRMVDLPNA